MQEPPDNSSPNESAWSASRAAQLSEQHLDVIRRHTNQLFGWLMVVQWITGIVFALVISPRTWSGADSAIHPHVLAAIFLGAAIASLPLILIATQPGQATTRHVVALGQMLYSALLIHLSGGRIETHFHVFGSLAFLAFYRDWRVLASASLVVGLDHFLRGIWWPQSVYGILTSSPWRWLEHVAWVAFEDLFLFAFIRKSVEEIRSVSRHEATLEIHQSRLEDTRERLEREIAVRKRTEDQLIEHANALRKSNAELEQFAYVSSHDLKEPLRMVTQYVGLIQRELAGSADERLSRYLAFALEGAMRMDALINDLLGYSRIDRQAMELEAVDLTEVMTELTRMLGLTIQESGATVSFSHLPTVTGDRSRLTRLFQNLISNGIKFRGNSPPVIAVEAMTDGTFVTISVRDNGIGIEEAHHERIFELFQRLHTRKEYPGTGIGLSICKKIVEQHHGSIWLESPTKEGGSVFFVRLPLGELAHPQREPSGGWKTLAGANT
jgi:signal transduction histidine kinase